MLLNSIIYLNRIYFSLTNLQLQREAEECACAFQRGVVHTSRTMQREFERSIQANDTWKWVRGFFVSRISSDFTHDELSPSGSTTFDVPADDFGPKVLLFPSRETRSPHVRRQTRCQLLLSSSREKTRRSFVVNASTLKENDIALSRVRLICTRLHWRTKVFEHAPQ